MKNIFSTEQKHTVTEANINFYANPFTHPKRKMNQHDFIYVLDGEWKIGQNGKVYDLKKDSLLILGANNTHYGAAPCTAGTKTMYFHIGGTDDDITAEKNAPVQGEICIDTLINAAENKNIKRFFSEIVNCKLSGNQRKADLYFELLLCELSENNIIAEGVGAAAKIKNIIHGSPEKFFSNKQLARMVNVSVKSAESKFKNLYGKTIHQYILDFKIREALSYFNIFPEITIKETAYNLGFYDEYHFSRQFKKIIGVSPSVYRKERNRPE